MNFCRLGIAALGMIRRKMTMPRRQTFKVGTSVLTKILRATSSAKDSHLDLSTLLAFYDTKESLTKRHQMCTLAAHRDARLGSYTIADHTNHLFRSALVDSGAFPRRRSNKYNVRAHSAYRPGFSFSNDTYLFNSLVSLLSMFWWKSSCLQHNFEKMRPCPTRTPENVAG